MSTSRATRLAVGLLLPLTLTASACAAGDLGDEAQIEVQNTGQVGEAEGSVTDGDAESAETDGDAESDGGSGEATDGTTDGPSEGGQATGGTDGSGGVNAKTAAARTIDDLTAAADLVNGADEAVAVFDQPNEGDIEDTFGADRWTFEGVEGQLLAIEVLDIGSDCSQDLRLNLESPSGKRGEVTWVGNGGCAAHGPLLLDETGTWVFEFAGGDGSIITDATGPYRFVPTVLTEFDVAPMTFGQQHDGEISELFGVDHWTFEAQAGDQLSVEVLSIGDDCAQDLNLALIDPFEERIELVWVGNGGCSLQGPFPLEREGTYALEFSGGYGGIIEDTTGAYQFVPELLG